MEGALRKKLSKLFSSVIVARKKEFSKNLCFTFIVGISLTFPNGLINIRGTNIVKEIPDFFYNISSSNSPCCS